jgi:SAM-dependent methyltransferase
MASVAEHYENLLARHYTWMAGGFDAKVVENEEVFRRLGIAPGGTARALDLGCGSGFQAVALANLGFAVTAVDLSVTLLAELDAQKGDRAIDAVNGDIVDASSFGDGFARAVCMGDTLTHLSSKADVEKMLAGCHAALAPGGRLILGYRDLSHELEGLDRFIPVRADEDRVFTCFLEYDPETVKVHDLVYARGPDGAMTLDKSMYRKLRLPVDWVKAALAGTGFEIALEETARGAVTLLASKS